MTVECSLIKHMQCWDGAMPTQLSEDKVDLYRVEGVVDMILLHESNAERNWSFAAIWTNYKYLYQMCIYCDVYLWVTIWWTV